VICGGVATKSGDFWWTRIVDRCLFAEVACERVTGENEATVGGFGSALATSSPSSSFLALGVCDIKSNQGVSLTGGVDQFRSDIWVVVVLRPRRTYKCSHLQRHCRQGRRGICDAIAIRRIGEVGREITKKQLLLLAARKRREGILS
jgi:hypothetical protein